MASLTAKVVKGRTYYYARECRRVDGKPRVVRTVYLGSLDSIIAATQAAQLFQAGNGFWSVAGSLDQTIFDAGELLHKRRAADAAMDQAAAQYKETVITAFQNVADTLRALQSDADALKAAVAAESAASNVDPDKPCALALTIEAAIWA